MATSNTKAPAQEVLDRVSAYQDQEGAWIDAVVRTQWPRWVIWLGERRNLFGLIMRAVIARFSYLEVVRQRELDMNLPGGNGFRPGKGGGTRVKAVTSTIYKHRKGCKEVVVADGEHTARPNCTEACVVATKRFELNVPIMS